MKLRTKRQIGAAAYRYLRQIVGYSELQAYRTFRYSCPWQIEELAVTYLREYA